jgi:hypothetical protein
VPLGRLGSRIPQALDLPSASAWRERRYPCQPRYRLSPQPQVLHQPSLRRLRHVPKHSAVEQRTSNRMACPQYGTFADVRKPGVKGRAWSVTIKLTHYHNFAS